MNVSTLASTRAPVWIVDRRYNLGFFILSLAAPLLLWAAFGAGWLTGVAVYAVFQLAFNMPHNVQTWTMSVFDRQDRAKNGQRYAMALAVILLLFGGTIAFSPDVAFPVLRDALVYWGYTTWSASTTASFASTSGAWRSRAHRPRRSSRRRGGGSSTSCRTRRCSSGSGIRTS